MQEEALNFTVCLCVLSIKVFGMNKKLIIKKNQTCFGWKWEEVWSARGRNSCLVWPDGVVQQHPESQIYPPKYSDIFLQINFLYQRRRLPDAVNSRRDFYEWVFFFVYYFIKNMFVMCEHKPEIDYRLLFFFFAFCLIYSGIL